MSYDCAADSHCPESEWCVLLGNCVGGEQDGDLCYTDMIGQCLVTNEYCRDDQDCYDPQPGACEPFPFPEDWQCPGGTCVRWPICPYCYIATATFGSQLEDKTDILRSFRDEYLLNNSVGKAFVTAYYKYSPPLAHYIAEREWLRSLVRILLLPVIGLASLFV